MMTKREICIGWCWLAFQYLLLADLIMLFADGLDSAAINFIYHLICFVACLLIFRRFLKTSADKFQGNMKNSLLNILISLGGYYLWGRLITYWIAVHYPDFFNANDAEIALSGAANPLLTFIFTVIFAPVSEECLFRGVIFSTASKWGQFPAYVLSVTAFSLIHIMGYIGYYEPMQLAVCFVQYLPAGIILAEEMERTDSIITPILTHSIINAAAMASLI